MTSKSVAVLLSDLGVTKTHSRPHVSNDNPYSEAQFKTLKYRPEFPHRFGCIEDARAICGKLFRWYNGEHYHGGIALLTPAAVHYGEASAIIAQRQTALDAAFLAHPERVLTHKSILAAVWGDHSAHQGEYLRVFVGQLRKKLEVKPASPQYIKTEPWVGYRFHFPG